MYVTMYLCGRNALPRCETFQLSTWKVSVSLVTTEEKVEHSANPEVMKFWRLRQENRHSIKKGKERGDQGNASVCQRLSLGKQGSSMYLKLYTQ